MSASASTNTLTSQRSRTLASSDPGIVASSIVTYYIGRRMRRDTVRRLAGPKLDRMIEVLKKYGLLAMTLLRLVPLAPFVVESIVAGAIHMRVWHVALGTAIGLLPGTLATTAPRSRSECPAGYLVAAWITRSAP